MAAERRQHDIEPKEEALEVAGSRGPVAAAEAVRRRGDPDVDCSVRSACSMRQQTSSLASLLGSDFLQTFRRRNVAVYEIAVL